MREIIVTVSVTEQGARVLVFNESKEKIAEGPATGRGYLRRHQLAVAPFGPEEELVIVRMKITVNFIIFASFK